MTEDVPLVVPEVNADHLALIETQSWRREGGGYIVTNPNCCAIGLVMALKPLEERFGIESLFVSTMQAVSGAGYPAWLRWIFWATWCRSSRMKRRSCRRRLASCWENYVGRRLRC